MLLGKFKWGHAFLSLNGELLKAYSECQDSTEIIAVHNNWLSRQNEIPKAVPDDAGAADRSKEEGDSSDSEDGLPPLERNVNHLTYEETDSEDELPPLERNINHTNLEET